LWLSTPGSSFVPEAYGERVSSKWNYLDGMNDYPLTERFW
jgi:hypothetical protein